MMNVHIVDDEEAIRDSLALLLDAHGYAVSCYPSATMFLEQATPGITGCVLVDLQMPGIGGLDLLNRMKAANITMPVIMMTGFGQVAAAVQAMKAGAVDFLEKPLAESQLMALLQEMGDRSEQQEKKDTQQALIRARLEKLTPREKEIFDQLVLGKQNKAVAIALGISPRTVELHRARIMEKLEARSLSDLVRLALSRSNEGLIERPDA